MIHGEAYSYSDHRFSASRPVASGSHGQELLGKNVLARRNKTSRNLLRPILRWASARWPERLNMGEYLYARGYQPAIAEHSEAVRLDRTQTDARYGRSLAYELMRWSHDADT